MAKMTKRQRDKLYQHWFMKEDSAEPHRQALWAFSNAAAPGGSQEDRMKERNQLHKASIAAFDDFLKTRVVQ